MELKNGMLNRTDDQTRFPRVEKYVNRSTESVRPSVSIDCISYLDEHWRPLCPLLLLAKASFKTANFQTFVWTEERGIINLRGVKFLTSGAYECTKNLITLRLSKWREQSIFNPLAFYPYTHLIHLLGKFVKDFLMANQ